MLAIRAENHPQIGATLSVLVPGLYRKIDSLSPSKTPKASGEQGEELNHRVDRLAISDVSSDQAIMDLNHRRAFFASLLLIYHTAHRDSTTAFWMDFFLLTQPPKGATVLQPLDKGSGRPQHQSLVDPSHTYIALALQVHHALCTPRPLTLDRLLSSDRLLAPQKRTIRFGLDKVRRTTWAIMKAAYGPVGVPIEWAGRNLLISLDARTSDNEANDDWGVHLKQDGSPEVERGLQTIEGYGGRLERGKVFFK